MEVYTEAELIKYNIGGIKNYGLTLIVKFPNANRNVYRHLETELLSNAKQIPTKQPMLANSEGIKSKSNLWTINNNKNLLIIKSDKNFTFISNELFIEGTIIKDNLDLWGEEFNSFYELKLEEFIIEVILVFKNEDKDAKDSCFIFNINTLDVIKSKNSIYRFLPKNQRGFSMNLNAKERNDFILIVPKLTERIFEVDNESILLYKVLMIFLDKTVNRELQNWELNWSTDVEKIIENFAKCLYIMAETAEFK